MHEPITAHCPVLPHCPVPAPVPATRPRAGAPATPAAPPVQSAAPSAPSASPSDQSSAPEPAAKPRGFQLISKQQHRLIASRGGKEAHARGLAHRYTSEEALLAGRKGGAIVSQDRKHMAEIGRKGALSSIQRRREKALQAAAPVS